MNHRRTCITVDPAASPATPESLFATGRCLPSGGAMAPADQDRVIEPVREAWGS